MPNRALGLRPGDPSKPSLKLANYLTGVIPAHPIAEDHFSQVDDWGMYGNDQYGVCGPTSVGNSRKLTTKYLTPTEESPSQDDVFDLYRRSGNPNFDPETDADDNGVVMQDMLSQVVKGGIGGVKALGFAKVDVKNIQEIQAAIAIFGFLLYGVTLETAQQSQTDHGIWDYNKSGVWGGHAILGGEYSQGSTGVVTWAEVVEMTDAFIQHQLDEAWVVIWPEHIINPAFQEGVDLTAFAADYTAITGRPFPVPVIPAPTPTPPAPTPPQPTPAIDPLDSQLALDAHDWLNHGHAGINRVFAKKLKVWLDAKGL